MLCVNGHENPDGQKFCGACGAPLAASALAEIDPAAPPEIAPIAPVEETTATRDESTLQEAQTAATVSEQASAASTPPAVPPPPPPSASLDEASSAQSKRNRLLIVLGIIVLGVVIAVVAAVAGSSTSSNDVKTASPGTEASPSAATEPPTTEVPTTTLPKNVFPMGFKVPYENGNSVQLYSYEQPVDASNGFSTPSAGSEFAVADAEVCAGATAEAPYNIFGFTAQTPDNRVYDASIGARDPSLSSGTIPAGGGCVRGWVTFEIPVGQRPTYILWQYGGQELVKWTVG